MVKIYQLPSEHENLFRDFDFARSDFDFSDYNLIYTDNTPFTVDDLEEIWEKYNIAHPSDYTDRSLSVSDIVEVDNKYFYCDNFNWVNVTKYCKKDVDEDYGIRRDGKITPMIYYIDGKKVRLSELNKYIKNHELELEKVNLEEPLELYFITKG